MQAADQGQVAAEVQEYSGEISRADSGVDEFGIERGELAAMGGDGFGEGFAGFQFGGDEVDGLAHGTAAHFAGDEAKALLDGQTGAGQLRQLLVEDEEILAAQHAGAAVGARPTETECFEAGGIGVGGGRRRVGRRRWSRKCLVHRAV